MDNKKSDSQEYYPPHFQQGYQQYPGSSGRPYSTYPYYQNQQMWVFKSLKKGDTELL